jgi:hypothetical protein
VRISLCRRLAAPATIDVITVPMVFNSAMGLYALGTSYLGFPGFQSTTVVKFFHGA